MPSAAKKVAVAAVQKKNVYNVLQPLTKFSQDYQRLAAATLSVQENGYAPYSNFLVGAALLHRDGSITEGCNWENCIYQGSCAERCAIISANAKGKRTATAVAVCGGSKLPHVKAPADAVVTPCGLCRQMLNEVAQLSQLDLDVLLIACGRKDAKLVKLSSLLPESFGPGDIGIDVKAWGKDKKPNAKRARDE